MTPHTRSLHPLHRFAVLAMVAAVLTTAAVPACTTPDAADAAAVQSPASVVDVKVVQPETRSVVKRYIGNVYPWESHGLGFMISGRVTSIRVSEGDIVRKGQLLATMQPEDVALVKRLTEIQADALKPNVERVESLVEQDVLPAAKLDEIKGQYDAAVTQDQRAKRQLDYTNLISLVDGVVYERRSSVGQLVNAGSPIVVVLEMKKVKFKMGVAQKDLGYFPQGRRIDVVFPGIPESYTGEVYHINVVGDAATRTYDVFIRIDNPKAELRAAMMGHAELQVAQHEGVFVPLSTIKPSRDGASHVVMIADENAGVAHVRPVVMGPMVDDLVLIESGLSPGDVVIVRGQQFLNDGDRIKVRK